MVISDISSECELMENEQKLFELPQIFGKLEFCENHSYTAYVTMESVYVFN